MADVWTKIAVGLAAGLLIFGPSGLLLGVAVLVNPAAEAQCLPGGALIAAQIPDSLTASTADGVTVTLNKEQLTRAATIVTVGGQTSGVGTQGVTVALIAALTESSLRMLANEGAYPESGIYPNDGGGFDHDSLGMFQMRPQSGWGTVAQLMDPTYQAKAFFGGPTGPNHGSPRGLLDIPGWHHMSDGGAAQSVEVSAYPDRYETYRPVAEAIITALAAPVPTSGEIADTPSVPETGRVVFPLPADTWVLSAPFGPRTDPITGQPEFHEGTDYAAPAATTIFSATDGRVLDAGMDAGTGRIRILSAVNGQPVSFTYLHMYQDGIDVKVGQLVSAGQQVGQVGSSGHSTGPHLHLEVHPGGSDAPAVDPVPWLTAHGATPRDGAGVAGCSTF